MNLKLLGWQRAVRGLREGSQGVLFTGLALVAYQYLKEGRSRKRLIYRKTVPVGATVVVRHARRGDPRLEIRKPPRRSPPEGAQTR